MSAARWGIRLVGDFEQPGAQHFVPCRDEENAQSRAAWWMRYRADVFAEAIPCEPGMPLGTRYSTKGRNALPAGARS